MFNLDTGQTLSLIAASAFMLLYIASARHMFQGQIKQMVQMALGWGGIMLVIAAGYAYRFELAAMGNRIAGGIVPGLMLFGAGGETTVSRDRGGQFSVQMKVRGETLSAMFDTGASAVVLTDADARRLGFQIAASDYVITVRTANGVTQAAPIMLPELSIGDIRETNVRAMAARPGALSENLLGMTFLERLASYEVRGDQLILRGRGR
ncbi:MAG: TIGR02281 family clan AA aspartic protease [Beijerinckiaceae bacterium]